LFHSNTVNRNIYGSPEYIQLDYGFERVVQSWRGEVVCPDLCPLDHFGLPERVTVK
jgi:hypothetical protein